MNQSSPASRSPIDASSAVAEFLPAIEQGLQQALDVACPQTDGCPARLADALRYAVLSPGKRLRPCMVLMAAEACGGAPQEAMAGAVAIEMIHAYSLIHDDLPAMDDDDLRRGRATVHVAFDEATAILAGDALQPMAFQHLCHRVNDPIRATEAIRVLANAAGPARLVGGQSDDLAAERQQAEQDGRDQGGHESGEDADRSLSHLESIHRRKTGALFAAALDLGAILVGGSEPARSALGNYAGDLGLGFQVADDLLDHTAAEAELGKRTGKDSSRGKLTFPSLMGVEASRQRVEALVESARRHASYFGDAAWRLNWLAEYVLERAR